MYLVDRANSVNIFSVVLVFGMLYRFFTYQRVIAPFEICLWWVHPFSDFKLLFRIYWCEDWDGDRFAFELTVPSIVERNVAECFVLGTLTSVDLAL